jgi:hypothetical protein
VAVKFNPFTGNLEFLDATGSPTEIQFNRGGHLDASADLTWDDTAKELGVGGDINLDDGGTYSTTLQMVTPTANRVISFPDATGTVGLVAGSSGQVTYNSAGAQAGDANLLWNATTGLALGKPLSVNIAGAASTPSVSFLGTWFTGGTSTTTKPKLLIEPSGTTSTGWSTSGTGLGVNAAAGFAGRLIDAQVNGVSRMVVTGAGDVGVGTSSPAYLLDANSNYFRFGNSSGVGLIQLGASSTASQNFHVGATGSTVRLWNGDIGSGSELLRITSAGNVGINETAPDYKLDVNGTFGFTPGSSVTPVDNGDVVFELTNNTTLTIKAKGSDGVVRSGTITLA